MASPCVALEISGLPAHTSLADISYHIKRHCTGLRFSEIEGVCTTAGSSLDKVMARLQFASASGESVSLHRLKGAKFRRVPLVFSAPGESLISQKTNENLIPLMISRLPQVLNPSLLEKHIETQVRGKVESISITTSTRGKNKVECLLRTSTLAEAVAAILRQASFEGCRLNVEVLHKAMTPITVDGQANTAMTALPSQDDDDFGSCTKDSGGRVKTNRRRRAAVCKDVPITSTPGHVEHVKKEAIPSPTDHEVTTSQELTMDGRSSDISHNRDDDVLRSFRQDRISRKIELMKGISTDFCRYVLSNPVRVYRTDKGEDELDDLFDEYFEDNLLLPRRLVRNEEQQLMDDSSEAWMQDQQASFHHVSGSSIPGSSKRDFEDAGTLPTEGMSASDEMVKAVASGGNKDVALLSERFIQIEDMHRYLGLSEVTFHDMGRSMEKDACSLITDT